MNRFLVYLLLLIPFIFIYESGSMLTYLYALFLLYVAVSQSFWDFPAFVTLFTLSLFGIYAIFSAIILVSVYFKPFILFEFLPLFLLFKLFGTLELFRVRGVRAFLRLWENDGRACWRVLSVVAAVSMLEVFLGAPAFFIAPFVYELVKPK